MSDNKKETTVCSFNIKVKTIKSFLKYTKAAGIDSSGSKVVLISDCILRFDDGRMWIIVTDEKRNLVVQVKTTISDLENPVDVPIEIMEFEKWLKSFKDGDIIKVSYEKGIIGLKTVALDIVFSTKREDTISCDLITNLEYGDDADKENLKRIEEHGNSIYKIEEGVVELFFGSKLTTNMKVSIKQLKNVISDGEKVMNREYPFDFQKNKLSVTIKSADVAKKQKISRTIYPDTYNVIEPFKITFSNRLTNAVNNINGNVEIFADRDAPMLIKSVDSEEIRLEVAHLITTY